MGGKTKRVAGCPSLGFLRGLGGAGQKTQRRNRETEARALALGNRKGGKSDGEKGKRGAWDKPEWGWAHT